MKLITFLLVTFLASIAFATTPGSQDLVFTQSSSAKTGTPNLRICVMQNGLKRDLSASGVPMQVFVCDQTLNYYLTKSITVPITNAQSIWIQVDQSTKYYHNGDLTNYMLIPSGGSWYEGVR